MSKKKVGKNELYSIRFNHCFLHHCKVREHKMTFFQTELFNHTEKQVFSGDPIEKTEVLQRAIVTEDLPLFDKNCQEEIATEQLSLF